MADNDQIFTFETSGLSEAIQGVNQLASAQKQLDQFMNQLTNSFRAQGQSISDAKKSAQDFANTNQITAQSFTNLSNSQLAASKTAQQLASEQLKLVSAYKGIESSVNSVVKVFDGNSRAALEATKAYQSLAKQGVDSGNSFTALNKNLGVTREQFDLIESTVKKSSSSFNAFGEVLKGIGQGIGKGIFDELISSAKQAIEIIGKSTLEFEKFKTVLTTQLGSEGAADKQLAKLQDFAAKTPFQLNEVVGSFIKLNQQGIEPTTETLTKLGDLASSQGKTLDQVTEAILAAANGESHRLKEFGIQAKDYGDTVAFTFKGVTKEVEKTPDAITKAITSFGDLQGVAGGMEAQSKTLGGQLSNLQDNVTKLATEFGNELLPVLIQFVSGLNESGDGLAKFAKEAGQNTAAILQAIANALKFVGDNSQIIVPLIQTLTLQFTALKAIAIVGTLQETAIGMAASAFATGGFSAALGVATTAAETFLASLLPILPLLIAIAGAVAVVKVGQFAADMRAANDDLEALTVSLEAQSNTALKLANQTKALSDEIKNSGTVTDEQKNKAQQLVKLNEDEIESLKKKADEISNNIKGTEEQQNAQKAAVEETKQMVKTLENQNKALSDSAGLNTKDAKAISDRTKEIKEQTKALKEKFVAEETALKRSKEDQEKVIKKTEEKEVKTIKKEENTAVSAEKKTQETEIKEIQKANAKEISEVTKAFNVEQEALKKQQAAERQAIEKEFNVQENEKKRQNAKEIQALEKAFTEQQSAKKKAADAGFANEQKEIDRQLKLEQVKSESEKKKLREQFEAEDKLAARKAELEAPLEAKKKSFEEKQQTEKVKFEESVIEPLKLKQEEALVQARAEFQKTILEPLQESQQKALDDKKLAFEESVLTPLKEAQEEKLNAKKAENEEKLTAIKEQFEEKINKKKEEFEQAKVERDRKFEDAATERKKKQEEAIEGIKKKTEEAAAKIAEDATKKRGELELANAKKVEDYKDERAKSRPAEPAPKASNDNSPRKGNSKELPGRKEGGSVSAGTAYLVGEVAPEVFVPNVSGTILNPQQALTNLTMLEKVGGTTLAAIAPSLFNPVFSPVGIGDLSNPTGGSDDSGWNIIASKLDSLQRTIDSRQPTITIPTTFTDDAKSQANYETMLKLNRMVARSMV
jgi:hypothetical protein